MRLRSGSGETGCQQAFAEKANRVIVPAIQPGMAGITFDRFQQMKVAIGTARVIERDQESRQDAL